MPTTRVSCIIPAYNEQDNIQAVVEVCSSHPLIKEVIVVNDGSNDKTYDIVKKNKGIKILNYAKNRGKNYAIMVGLLAAREKYIFTCDADLTGVTRDNITSLIIPVIEQKAEVSIAIIKSAPYTWRLIGLDYICGIRVFHKDMINSIAALERIPPYGIEVYFNKIMIERQTRIKVVKWCDVKNPGKTAKYGKKGGLFGDMKMIANIFQVIGLNECVTQIYKMRKLRV